MHWDGTITAGNVLEAAVMAVSVIIAYFRLRERIVAIETQLQPLADWWNDNDSDDRRRARRRRVEDR